MNYSAIPNLARAASLSVNTAALPSRRTADFSAAYDEWIDREILGQYDITRDEENSLFDGRNEPLQLAWLVVHKANQWDRAVVIFDGQAWACVDMQSSRYGANAMIAGVKRHIALRRAQRQQAAA